jgi:hypothetical protein
MGSSSRAMVVSGEGMMRVMSENNVKELVRRKSPQLPAQLPDPNIVRSMNDLVQVVFAELYSESQEFRDLLQAVWPEEAVEGNLLLDDGDAAGMMRVKAATSWVVSRGATRWRGRRLSLVPRTSSSEPRLGLVLRFHYGTLELPQLSGGGRERGVRF